MNQIHECKLDNGDKCFIHVWFNDGLQRLEIEKIEYLPKGKRKVQEYNFHDDIAYRRISNKEELYPYKLAKYQEMYSFLNKVHLLEALNKTWESLKPTLD